MAADAVVPPSPPSNVFGVQGDSLRPLHPAWGDGGHHLLTLPRRDPLPRLPLHSGAEAGRFPRRENAPFDCMLLSLSAGFRGFQARRRRVAVADASLSRREASRSRRVSVAYPSRMRRVSVAERDSSKEPVPYNGIGSGPSLPRTVLPLGVFPQRPCHRGILYG